MCSLLFIVTSAFSIYAVFYYRKNGTLPGNNDLKDPETVQSDDLEFNGASPHAHNQIHTEQEIQQQPTEIQNSGHISPVHNHEDQSNAILPPRPLYPKAPRTPLQQDFEPVDASYHGMQPHDPREYNPGPSPYQGFGYDSGDYALPYQHQPSMAELPTLRVDTTPGYGPGGGSLPFPAADYGR